MKIDLSPEDEDFLREVRAFLDRHLDADLRAAEAANRGTFCDVAAITRWHEILYRQGWVAPNWPVEYGGPDWTVVQRFLFQRECELAGAPRTFTFGLSMCGPVLMRYGTPEQKDYFLPRILSGEHRWCQGYSEPGSGSDLASLKTRAVRDGDFYVVDGSKIWTTFAHHANWIFCLVRTDPNAKPQRGISFLLIDLSTPGVTMRPIVNLAGDHEFNQVFFDSVRVPAANLVGAENDGWSVAKHLLEFERGGEQYAPRIRSALRHVERLAAAEGALDAAFAEKLAAATIDMEALETTELRVMSALSRGQSPGTMASLLKLRGSELVQRVTELAVEALGPYAVAAQPVRWPGTNAAPIGPEEGATVTARYLYERSITIYGGTSEVQRNILARSLLGL